ncbi:MAG: Ig-like domain-containing protein [Oligoflexia bacterium]|nr:Ig-like domain-containing protein [Oligoflexia bacterium]
MTITLKDAYGNPVPGQTVAFSATGSGNTLTQPASVTNASGQAVGGIASTVAETKTLSISTPAGFTSDTTTVTFIASTVSVANSTITGTGPVTANGSATSTITITLEDVNSNPVSGITPSFAGSGSGNSYGACSATNASGISACTMSSTVAQTETLSITGPISKSGGSVGFTAGPAAKLVWTTAPSGGTAGTAWSTQGVIQIEDAQGNLITSGPDATAQISLSVSAGTGSISGTTTLAASGGAANFSGSGIFMTLAGSKTIRATKADTSGSGGTGSLSVDQSGVLITAAAASTLSVTGFPSSVIAGSSNGLTVTALDSYGNTATSYTGSVHFTSGDSQAVLPANYTFAGGDNGVHAFTGLILKTASTTAQITATDTGSSSITGSESPITVQAASADHLVKLAGDSQSGQAGATLATAIQVQVQDIYGNPVSGNTVTFTASSGASSSPASIASDANGKASTSFTLATVVGTSTCTVTGTSLSGSPSSLTFTENVTPGPAAKLAFGTQPGNGQGGSALSTQPVVWVEDTYGNLVTSATNSVSVAIGTNPSSGTLSGTSSIAASGGVASFSGLLINSVGTGYTLTASGSGLTSVTSSSFNITVGAAAQLAFTTQPGGGTGGLSWSTQPAVTVQDAGGNTVAISNASITLAISTNPGSGTLSGTNMLSATSGVANFSGLSINTAANGYVLTATSSGLTSAVSSAFNITVGPAAKLAFTTQPGGGTGGLSWNTQPVIAVQDAGGNTVTGSSASIALAIGTNPSSGALSGTGTLSASSGVATFSGLSINTAGTGYTLIATSSGLTSATSSAFNVTVGPAAQLAFTTQPGGGAGGATWSTQPVVAVEDAGGNTVTGSSASIALAIGTNPSSGTLSGTATLSASSGAASFSGLSINTAGTGYTLTATSSGLTSATSSAFNITVGSAAKLAFTTQPGGGSGGTAWVAQPVVTVEDAGGNTITGSSASIALAIGTNPSSGTLSGTATLLASSGVASFSGLSINTAGTGYTLTATSSGLSSATSSAFNITVGSAAKLAFTTQPSGATGGSAFTTQPVVSVEDAGGNVVSSATNSVALAIGTNPSLGTLSGTATLSASSGVASFSGLSINSAGAGYTLIASSSGLTNATSSVFNVNIGAAVKLTFTTQPGGGAGGTAWGTQPLVVIQDAGGNQVITSSASISLAIGTNPSGGTLSGTSTVSATGGQVNYSGLSINTAGTGYTLTASSSGLTSATSSSFNITVGPAAQLAFTAQPGGGTGGVAWGTEPIVTVQDAGGNTVSGSSASIALAIGTNPSSGTLSGTAALSASSGIASFAGLSINKAGTGYTLTASSSGLSSATSSSFNITVGPATQLAFTTQPGGGTGGTAWSTQPVVTIEDAGGNTITGSSASIALAIGTNPSGGTLSGTSTLAASSGVASFSGLSINTVGTGYTLIATSSGLTSATSSNFNIAVGPAASFIVAGFTSPATAGTAYTFTVTAKDAGGNTTTGYAGTVHFSSSDGSAALPANSTLTSGAGTFSATLATAGTQSLTATDTVTSSITGTQSGITVYPSVGFSVATQDIAVNQGTATVTVSLNSPATGSISIPISVNGSSTAVNNTDYTYTASPVAFSSGQSSQTISIPILDQLSPATPNATIVLKIGTPTGPVALGSTTSQTLTIREPSLDLNFATMIYPTQSSLASAGITFTRASTATYMDCDGLIKTAAVNQPRIDCNPTTGQPNGLLIEQSSTNLIYPSVNIGTWGGGSGSSPSFNNAALALDGTFTASELVEDTSTGYHYKWFTISATSSTAYTCSIYAKPKERTKIQVKMDNTAFAASNCAYTFDLSAGSATSMGGTCSGYGISALANGWYRLWIATSAGSTATGGCDFWLENGSGTLNYTGDGNSGLYVWGAQLEANSFPTNYIPTTTASVTRSTDSATSTSISSWYTNGVGSIYTQYIEPTSVASGNFGTPFELDDGTWNNRIYSYDNTGVNRNQQDIVSGGSTVLTTWDTGRYADKQAIAYGGTSASAADNNSLVATASSITIPTVNRLGIGTSPVGGGQMNGAIARFTYFPYQIENTPLTNMTAASTNFRTYTPSANLTLTSQTVIEPQGTVYVTAALSEPATTTVTVPYTVGGTAVSGTNYSGLANGNFTFAAGSSRSTISFQLLDDGSSTNPTVTVALGSGTGYSLGATTTQTITIERPSLDLNFAAMYNPATQISQAPYNAITFTRSSIASYMGPNGLIQYAASGVPRVDYNPTTHQPNGLLIEEARTNSLLQSAAFQTSWGLNSGVYSFGSGSVANTTATLAPDGTYTAALATENTTTGTHAVNQSVTATTAQTWTFSVFVKPKGTASLTLALTNGANQVYGAYTLSGSGTAGAGSNSGTGNGAATSIKAYPNGWYQCSLTGEPATSGTTVNAVIYIDSTPGTTSFTGDGASGLYLWGAQLETGAFPTSYIPTTTAVVTRTADSASFNGVSWLTASQGSFLQQLLLPNTQADQTTFVVQNSSISSNSIFTDVKTATPDAQIFYGGTNQTWYFSPNVTMGSPFTLANSYSANNVAEVTNGNFPVSSTTATMTSGITQGTLGARVGGGDNINGDIARFTYYPVQLSNPQLQILSSPYQYTPRTYTPSVTLTQASRSVMQSDGQAFFVASLSQPAMSTVTVPYTISGTAVSGTDYSGLSSSGTLTFTAGQSIALVQFTVNTTTNNDLTVIMTLGLPTGATLGTNTSETIYLSNVTTGLALTTNSVINNGSTVTYSGTCAPGLTITVSGAQSSSTTCSGSGTWSWTSSTISSDGNYTFNFTQSDGINTSSVASGAYDRDTTAPTAVATFADGNYTTTLTQSPLMTWTATTDPGTGASGIAYYMLAIGSTAGGTDIVSWTNVGNVTFYQFTGLSLTDGNMYYGSIKAVDNAGNISSVTQGDGFAVVTETPTLNLNLMQSSLSNQNSSYPAIVQFSNASGAGIAAPTYYNSSGVLTAAPENMIRNNTMQGAAAGSPGTLPTNWSLPLSSGLSYSVIGTGTEAGISYIDIQVSGTNTSGSWDYAGIFFDTSSAISASASQSWIISSYLKLVSGSLPSGTGLAVQYYNGGSYISNSSANTVSPTSAGLSTQRFSYAVTTPASTTSVYPYLYFNVGPSAAVNFTLRIGMPQLELGTSASSVIATSGSAAYGPRFDYNPGNCTSGTCSLNGLLIEEARTNSLTYSAAVGGTNWSLSDVTATQGAATAPDGSASAAALIDNSDGSATTHQIYQNVSGVTVAQTWTYSVYAKPDGRTQMFMYIFDTVNHSNDVQGLCTLSGSGSVGTTGNVGNASGVKMGVQALANGWYRCWISGQPNTGAGTSVQAMAILYNGSSTSYIGNGSSGIYLWGAQLEAGAFQTSYIPTTTTAMTRSADIATIPSLGSWFNASAGTIVSSGIFPTWTVVNSNRLFNLDDGTISNEIFLLASSSTSLLGEIKSGGTNQFSQTFTTSLGSIVTGAVGYQSNNVAIAAQGTISTSTSATVPTGLNELRIGSAPPSGYFADGWIQSLEYYNSQLTNAAVQELTHP